MDIDERLMAIIVCPACHGGLEPGRYRQDDEDREELVCVRCGRGYPVRDDIPVLLVDEARQARPAAES